MTIVLDKIVWRHHITILLIIFHTQLKKNTGTLGFCGFPLWQKTNSYTLHRYTERTCPLKQWTLNKVFEGHLEIHAQIASSCQKATYAQAERVAYVVALRMVPFALQMTLWELHAVQAFIPPQPLLYSCLVYYYSMQLFISCN